MEYIKKIMDTNNHLLAPAVVFGFCFILFGFVLKSGLSNFSSRGDSITVTGSAERVVKSDTAKLTITVSEKVMGDINGNIVSKTTSANIKKTTEYLKRVGFAEEEISTSNISLSPICEFTSQGYENCNIGVRGYMASQNIFVDTKNLELVESTNSKLAAEVVGVTFSNTSAEYFYNALKDIRVEMLTEATKNAKERAEAVAKAGGASIGKISSLSSGVFQVTQVNSVNIDDYGAYDTSTIDKKVTATVKANFTVN